MAMTGKERQRVYRERAKASGRQPLQVVISGEAKAKLEALAKTFGCSATDTLEHIIKYCHDDVEWN